MKLGLLSWIYSPEARRGSERLIRDLADGLIARGHEPVLITSVRGRPGHVDEDGLEVVRKWRLPQRPFLAAGLPPGSGQIALNALAARRGGFDVIHAFHPADAVAAAHSGRPSLFFFQGVLDRGDWKDRARVLATVKHGARNCDVVVVNSQAAAAAFAEHTDVTPRVINPGVDLHAFKRVADRSEQPTIFCPADPSDPRKAVPELDAAIAQIRRKRPDVRAQTLRKGSDPFVRVEELARHYSEAWVTVLPSYRESFGLVLAESLACGTPVVARDDAAGPEIVDRPGIGTLFNGAGLADAIERVLDEPHDPAACRARAEDFSIDRCVEGYLSLYRQIAGS